MEQFKKFKESGIQELSMTKDLEADIVENNIESPFYGIYFGDILVAKMSLYRRNAKLDYYLSPPQDFLELRKLEVLEAYRGQDYGQTLVDYAKSLNLPIKTYARCQSQDFWAKMGFASVSSEQDPNLTLEPLIWIPNK